MALVTSSVRLRRAQRSAKALIGGQKILDYLLAEPTKKLLIQAANDGVPPVSRISNGILSLAKTDGFDIKALSIRQFIGTSIRAILEEEGYKTIEKGIRLPKDPVFTSGSIYGKCADVEPSEGTILERILENLTDSEAQQALGILKARLQNS